MYLIINILKFEDPDFAWHACSIYLTIFSAHYEVKYAIMVSMVRPNILFFKAYVIFFSFLQLNRNVAGPRHPGIIGDRGSGSFSRESKCKCGFIFESISDITILY